MVAPSGMRYMDEGEKIEVQVMYSPNPEGRAQKTATVTVGSRSHVATLLSNAANSLRLDDALRPRLRAVRGKHELKGGRLDECRISNGMTLQLHLGMATCLIEADGGKSVALDDAARLVTVGDEVCDCEPGWTLVSTVSGIIASVDIHHGGLVQLKDGSTFENPGLREGIVRRPRGSRPPLPSDQRILGGDDADESLSSPHAEDASMIAAGEAAAARMRQQLDSALTAPQAADAASLEAEAARMHANMAERAATAAGAAGRSVRPGDDAEIAELVERAATKGAAQAVAAAEVATSAAKAAARAAEAEACADTEEAAREASDAQATAAVQAAAATAKAKMAAERATRAAKTALVEVQEAEQAVAQEQAEDKARARATWEVEAEIMARRAEALEATRSVPDAGAQLGQAGPAVAPPATAVKGVIRGQRRQRRVVKKVGGHPARARTIVHILTPCPRAIYQRPPLESRSNSCQAVAINAFSAPAKSSHSAPPPPTTPPARPTSPAPPVLGASLHVPIAPPNSLRSSYTQHPRDVDVLPTSPSFRSPSEHIPPAPPVPTPPAAGPSPMRLRQPPTTATADTRAQSEPPQSPQLPSPQLSRGTQARPSVVRSPYHNRPKTQQQPTILSPSFSLARMKPPEAKLGFILRPSTPSTGRPAAAPHQALQSYRPGAPRTDVATWMGSEGGSTGRAAVPHGRLGHFPPGTRVAVTLAPVGPIRELRQERTVYATKLRPPTASLTERLDTSAG